MQEKRFHIFWKYYRLLGIKTKTNCQLVIGWNTTGHIYFWRPLYLNHVRIEIFVAMKGHPANGSHNCYQANHIRSEMWYSETNGDRHTLQLCVSHRLVGQLHQNAWCSFSIQASFCVQERNNSLHPAGLIPFRVVVDTLLVISADHFSCYIKVPSDPCSFHTSVSTLHWFFHHRY